MKRKIFIVMTAFMLLLASVSERVSAVNYHEDEIEEYLLGSLVAANIPGMSLSIVSSEREVYSAAFGEVEEPTSNMCVSTVSQTFTSLAVMQLVEKNKISLTDTVGDYLPDYGNISNVTIVELLTQTSGIGMMQTMDNLSIKADDKAFEAAYANYNILGLIVEKVSGQSYEEYLEKNIFEPLEMSSTCSRRNRLDAEGVFVGGYKDYFGMHIAQDAGYDAYENWCQIPAGGIVSNVKDMGKYMQMYLNMGGRILSYSSMEKILYNGNAIGKDLFETDTLYAYGWKETVVEDETVLYCEGAVDDYVSAVFLLPERNTALTMLFNSADLLVGQKMTEQMMVDVITLLMGGTVETLVSDSYLYPHVGVDIVCLIVVLLALLPLFTITVWLRSVRRKFSVLRTVFDVILHIALPVIIWFGVENYLGMPWSMIERIVPAYTYVAWGVVALLIFELIVKLLLGLTIGRKKLVEEETDESDDMQNVLEGQPPLTEPQVLPERAKKANASVSVSESQNPNKDSKVAATSEINEKTKV